MSTADSTTDWPGLAIEQLTWHWEHHARRRLEGLTTQEYLWEPVAGAWNVRPRGTAATPHAGGSGDWSDEGGATPSGPADTGDQSQ